jgi:hypothetical protein
MNWNCGEAAFRPASRPIARRLLMSFCWGAVVASPASLAAQTPTRADSLAAELRRVRARLDSLERVVAGLSAAARDTARATDELAALRAAARVAAGDTARRTAVDSVGRQGRASGSNLNRLNPEISVTGDVRFQMDPDAADQDNVEVREFEFSFQSALDPYAATKIFVAASEEGVEVEEGYAYWSGIPGGLPAARCGSLPAAARRAEPVAPARPARERVPAGAPGVLWRRRAAG